MLSLVTTKHPQKIACLKLDSIFMLPCANLVTMSTYYNENFSHYYELWLLWTFTLP